MTIQTMNGVIVGVVDVDVAGDDRNVSHENDAALGVASPVDGQDDDAGSHGATTCF